MDDQMIDRLNSIDARQDQLQRQIGGLAVSIFCLLLLVIGTLLSGCAVEPPPSGSSAEEAPVFESVCSLPDIERLGPGGGDYVNEPECRYHYFQDLCGDQYAPVDVVWTHKRDEDVPHIWREIKGRGCGSCQLAPGERGCGEG